MADEDLHALAGEYVLGTLTADERREFLRRLAREPEAVVAVLEWQEKLAPLALALDEVAPPVDLLGRIETAISDVPARRVPGRAAAANDNRAARWRMTAIAAALVAVVSAGIGLRHGHLTQSAQAPGGPLPAIQPVSLTSATGIAALSEKGQTPGLFVTYDRETGRIKVLPVGLTPDARHSFELWLIKGKAAPKPMGLVDARKPETRGARIDTSGGITFALSVEPVGGSPTGLPTGPVIYSGPLVQVPPEA